MCSTPLSNFVRGAIQIPHCDCDYITGVFAKKLISRQVMLFHRKQLSTAKKLISRQVMLFHRKQLSTVDVRQQTDTKTNNSEWWQLPRHLFEVYAWEQQSKCDVILMKHSSWHAVVRHLLTSQYIINHTRQFMSTTCRIERWKCGASEHSLMC